VKRASLFFDGDGLGRGDDRQHKLTIELANGAWAGPMTR
jgi:hypothetical protein